MREPLKIKEKLRQGQAVGVVSGLPNADMVEYLGQCGLDGVWLEVEHGPVSMEQIGDY